MGGGDCLGDREMGGGGGTVPEEGVHVVEEHPLELIAKNNYDEYVTEKNSYFL